MDISIQLAEYEALRGELLQRLSFQQEMINFTLVLAGILIPLLFMEGKKNMKYISPMLLMGAFISCMLALISLKQHLIIANISEYISTKINLYGKGMFGGWENYYFQNKLFDKTIPTHLKFLMGLFEVFFPLIVSVVYLVFTWVLNFSKNVKKPLLILCSIAIISCIIYTGLWGWKIRNYIIDGRNKLNSCLTFHSSGPRSVVAAEFKR